MQILVPSVYFGNIYYFQVINQCERFTIEQHEHFEKQTFRNRCEVYGANGKLNLIVPVSRSKGARKTIKETRINNSEFWQRNHWRSLESAYRTSPYFEFYEEEFKHFFEKRYDFLFDLNNEITEKMMQLIQLQKPNDFTTAYDINPGDKKDFRSLFDPRIKPENFRAEEYVQVFGQKHGFIENLSVIDLLCNCGPESLSYL